MARATGKASEGCSWCRIWKLAFIAIKDDGSAARAADQQMMGGECRYCPWCGRKLIRRSKS